MPDERYSALEFGKVLAKLQAQDAVLAEMHSDIERIFSMIHEMQLAKTVHPQPPEKRDWMEILASAVFGAVAYFIGQKLIGG